MLFAVNALEPGAGSLISGPNAVATRGLRSERGQACANTSVS